MLVSTLNVGLLMDNLAFFVIIIDTAGRTGTASGTDEAWQANDNGKNSETIDNTSW